LFPFGLTMLSFLLQLCRVDATIVVINASLRQTGLTLEMVSACDYRSILVPLLKSLVQVCIVFSSCSLNILTLLPACVLMWDKFLLHT
jgi:hypothetical protein